MSKYNAVFQSTNMYAKWRQFFVVTRKTLGELLEEVNKHVSASDFHQGYVWRGRIKMGKPPTYFLTPKRPYKVSYTQDNFGEGYTWKKGNESPLEIVTKKRRGKFDDEKALVLLHEFDDAYTFHLQHNTEMGMKEAIQIYPYHENANTEGMAEAGR